MTDIKISTLNVMKKDDLAQFLLDNGLSKESIEKMKRTEMIDYVRTNFVKQEILTAPIEPEEVTQGFVAVEKAETPQLTPADPGWTDYVLGLLTAEEKYKDFPTADGLRRLFEVLVGEIISTEVNVVQAPNNENERRAVVTYTMKYITQEGKYKSITDAADCYFGNTVAPYFKHATATATTMAEGRCLRKALRIRTLVKEEAQAPEGEEAKLTQNLEDAAMIITGNQQNIIKVLVGRLNIDIAKLLADLPIKGKTLDSLTQQEAQAIIRTLNEYHRPVLDGGQVIPENIKKEVKPVEAKKE